MYVKIFTSILDSSLSENRRLRHFFIDLLLCSDADGNVLMTNNAIGRRIGADLDEVEWGLGELQKPDPCSLSKDAEGRRIVPLEGHGYGWKIVNYERYRDIKSSEQRRRDTAERVRRWRERQKAGGDGSQVATEPSADSLSADFEAFWSAYPRKVGKANALKAWAKNGRPELPVLLAALEKQKGWEQWQKDGGKFIPHPATWLNGKRWEDEGPAGGETERKWTDGEILREAMQ